MAKIDTSATANAFASVNSDVQARRNQIAQFAIYRAATQLSESKLDDAIREFKNALAFDPQNATAHTYLGKIYQSQGKTAEAITEFKRVVQNDRTSVDALNNLGSAYMSDKQYANAEQEFKLAARLDPVDQIADYTLGLLFTETDRFGEAETQFNKVARVSPRDGNVPYSLGVLFNKMGRPEAAVQQLEKALTLRKEFPAANYELGAAYLSLGETEKADTQLSILVTKDAGFASDLLFLRDKPKIAYIEESNNINFISGLGGGTPLWMLNPMELSTPNASIRVAVAIQFTNEMDAESVMNPANWEISRAQNTEGGYYNNFMPIGANEVAIPERPFSVIYDPLTQQARVFFILNQNSSLDFGKGNAGATIDPSHLVFKFSGIDAAGRQMDTTGDQIDGYSIRAF
jgi:tetratricopeptide (TPR) repeat protein